MGDVALKIPLAALCFRRLGQRHRPRVTRVHALEKSCDAAALPRRIAPFEEGDDALPCRLDMGLQFQELELQLEQLLLVDLSLELAVIGKPPRAPGPLLDLLGQLGIIDVEFAYASDAAGSFPSPLDLSDLPMAPTLP